MTHRLIFEPHVPDDLSIALDYYESISSELANRFRQQVDDRFDDISERPESFPFDIDPIRFAKLDRFPYLIFFVRKLNYISILAIVHSSSEPDRWRNRS